MAMFGDRVQRMSFLHWRVRVTASAPTGRLDVWKGGVGRESTSCSFPRGNIPIRLLQMAQLHGCMQRGCSLNSEHPSRRSA
jgi:hypothetical protein